MQNSWPPQIMIRTDGVVELKKNSIFYSKATSSNDKDILLLTGDSQPSSPESQYVLSEQIWISLPSLIQRRSLLWEQLLREYL